MQRTRNAQQCRAFGGSNYLVFLTAITLGGALSFAIGVSSGIFQLVMAIWREGFQTEVVTGTWKESY
jgi:hypothetical protein